MLVVFGYPIMIKDHIMKIIDIINGTLKDSHFTNSFSSLQK